MLTVKTLIKLYNCTKGTKQLQNNETKIEHKMAACQNCQTCEDDIYSPLLLSKSN